MSAAPPAPDAAAAPLVDPLTALLRRFAVDFLTGQSWQALGDIMAADYRLDVGGHTIAGREEQYRPAMRTQFDLFPGLCVTVHDVVVGEAAIAMRFTEHGASRRDAGQRAAWQGVSLFRVEAGQLQTGWAEEDYIARKRQLRTGVCDPIEPPHAAPWDVRSKGVDLVAEAVARHWLLSGSASLLSGSLAGAHGVTADPARRRVDRSACYAGRRVVQRRRPGGFSCHIQRQLCRRFQRRRCEPGWNARRAASRRHARGAVWCRGRCPCRHRPLGLQRALRPR